MTNWERGSCRIIAALIIGGGTLLSHQSVRTQPNYPPEVVSYVEADFQARLEDLQQQGVPETVGELAMWYPEPPRGDNAAEVYKEAFAARDRNVRLDLLKKAASMSHYRYPIDQLLVDCETGLRMEAKGLLDHMEHNKGMRDAARLVNEEAITQAHLGDNKGATEALVTGFGMLRHQACEPTIIAHLVRYACRELVMAALETALGQLELDQNQLRQLDGAIRQAYQVDALAKAYFADKVLTGVPDAFAHLSSVCVTEARDLGSFRVALAVVAVERFREAEGELPDSLDELVPKYLKAIPHDPFVQGEIRYLRRAKGYAVHSVGVDGLPRKDIATVERPGSELRDEVAIIVDR